MGKQDELPVITKVYELALWALPVVGKIPRSHRYTLGERTEASLLTVLERLIRAKFARDKAPHLDEADRGSIGDMRNLRGGYRGFFYQTGLAHAHSWWASRCRARLLAG